MKRLLIAAALSLGFGLVAAGTSMAVHKGAGDLTCGQCHTMHNSQGGASLGGNTDGSLVLLRGAVTTRAQIHNFCLQCHASDGAQAGSIFQPHNNSAPKVLLDSTVANKWDQATAFNKIGGGGDFQYACGNVSGGLWDCATVDGDIGLGRGHSLGKAPATPPGESDGAISEFTCTSCHDPHGTDSTSNAAINKFRNLRKTPTGSGSATVALDTTGATAHSSWVGGITGTFSTPGSNFVPVDQALGTSSGGATAKAIWPVFRDALNGTAATDTANSNSYGGGANGISKWCATCHDKWHEMNVATNSVGGQGAMGDWRRHPVDNVLDEGNCTSAATEAGCSGAGVDIFDAPNYSATTDGQVLPVASGQATNRVFYTKTTGAGVTATSDKIMCLSCHFAHGGPYYDNLRWDYLQSVSSGAQTANGVPLTKGCQLCHNRGG